MSRSAALALVAALAVAACRRPAPAGAGAAPVASADRAPAAGAAPTSARLVAPEPVRYAPRVLATGNLKARQASPLALPVAGTLERVAVKRGDEVKEGALLASLDAGAASAARKQAEAAVAAARAQLALADDALARVERIRREEGASEAQLFQARSQRDLAAAQLAAADAQLELARVNLAHHFLYAPFPGVVTRVPDGLGITVTVGTPVVTLMTTRQLVLETTLTQEEAAPLRRGEPVAVTVPATGAHGEGTISVVVAAVDPQTNRVPLEIAVPNPDGRFLPNAFARAELPRGGERAAWRVPAGALVQRAGGFAAWAAGGDGRVRAIPVRVLAEEGDAAIVVPDGGAWPDGLRAVDAPPIGLAEGGLVAEAGR